MVCETKAEPSAVALCQGTALAVPQAASIRGFSPCCRHRQGLKPESYVVKRHGSSRALTQTNQAEREIPLSFAAGLRRRPVRKRMLRNMSVNF